MNKRNIISVDEWELREITNNICEQSDSFQAEMKRLNQCLGELPSFWSGTAAIAFAESLSDDLEQLERAGAVFSALADNYSFALSEYEKNARKTIEIVSALSI